MGMFGWLKRSTRQNTETIFEEVPATGEHENLRDSECEGKARKIKALRDCPTSSAVENLLRVAQFDARGELSIHAGIALATRKDKGTVKEALLKAFGTVPPVCEAGYPPKPGDGIYPKARLLYVLAWMRETKLMRDILDKSGSWPGAGKSKILCYELCENVSSGTQAVADKLVYLEYLDEAGTRELMDLTLEWYPEIEMNREIWRNVRRPSAMVRP